MDNLPAAPDAASAAGPAVANGDEAGMEEDEADELAKYNFEDYDDEDDSTPGVAVSGAGMGNGLRGLTYHASNEEDPYIQLQVWATYDPERASSHPVSVSKRHPASVVPCLTLWSPALPVSPSPQPPSTRPFFPAVLSRMSAFLPSLAGG